MKNAEKTSSAPFTATRNACKLCTPFGACMVFKGIAGCIPFLHGSQGCSTYIRRYMISHYREPVDIASSNFSEETAIFGGRDNLFLGLKNVIQQYEPAAIGVATTCLSETIGDDMPGLLKEFKKKAAAEGLELPQLIHVSTPSYSGSHADGYMGALTASVDALAGGTTRRHDLNLFSAMVSPEDLRWLKATCEAFGLSHGLLPDYSETLDGGVWEDYRLLTPGGTPVEAVQACSAAALSVELSGLPESVGSPARLLEERYHVPACRMPLPIGIRLTDAFMQTLSDAAHIDVPEVIQARRSRLVDAYIDGHKHLFGKKAIVYGDEDMVLSLLSFLEETGIQPILALTGGRQGRLSAMLETHCKGLVNVQVMEESDFEDLAEAVEGLEPDLLIGHSKGYSLARKLSIPLVRVGFPVHDRFGGSRIEHLGYRGTQILFDRLINTLLDERQARDPWGYTYM